MDSIDGQSSDPREQEILEEKFLWGKTYVVGPWYCIPGPPSPPPQLPNSVYN